MNTDSYKALSQYIDLLLDAICVVDKDGRFEFVSAGAERIFGYTPQEMLGRPMIELVHPDDRARTLQTASEINAGAVKVDFENRYIRKDGQTVYLLWSARWSETDKRRVAVARDITRSKKIEARQAAIYAISEAAFASDDLPALYRSIQYIIAGLIPICRFAIVLPGANGGQLDFAYDSLLQASAVASGFDILALCAEVVRRSETVLLTGDNKADLPAKLQQLVAGAAINWLGVPLKSHTAVMGALMVQNSADAPRYSNSEMELLEFVSVQVAVAIERKQMLDRLHRNALYDQLTQLPNRELFYDRLQLALTTAEREQSQFALLYLDLDKFKQINDNYGHHIGDELLQHTAQRILCCLRSSDTVARFGGDEFVILLQQIDNEDLALLLAEKIRQALNLPFNVSGNALQVLPSVGVALYPQHSKEVQTLILSADNAMYLAKKAGGNRIMLSEATAVKHRVSAPSAPV
ncbi:diguanylate cyclase (GGDEF)-like protein/PAS domain S-box-containing protein [Rheinheimera pacifica]|uniref:sensor domain-containing protein n=1 Tax=Rheinheimera pacifica TaxID=173990 RepID=UPI00216A440C|nr:diguanylate cyclase [Rheinheimera pacifica]MCS4306450.1 diguanylate cyclase (GGDEF)-like protein/PAS domain S-box-containing protein [Rheinheimera pacifica]